jgi:hypothetical protein
MALIKRIEGATRVLGKDQGYIPLPVRDRRVIDQATGKEVNELAIAFELTPLEMEGLINGMTLYVSMYAITPPPVRVYVGASPDDPV